MRENAPIVKRYIQDEFSSLPKLKDFDWRLDVKTASNTQERLKQPVLYVKLDIDAEKKEDQNVLFQISKG